jgi:hypothetical protein
MTNPETPIVSKTIDLINRSRLAEVYRQNTGATKGGRVRFGLCKGSSDIIGWERIGGRFVAIEVKVPGKEPSPEQHEFLARVNAAGGIGLWGTDPVTILRELESRLRSV